MAVDVSKRRGAGQAASGTDILARALLWPMGSLIQDAAASKTNIIMTDPASTLESTYRERARILEATPLDQGDQLALLEAERARRAREDAADDKRRRKLGLEGTLPIERRSDARPVARGLIDVRAIMDDCLRSRLPPPPEPPVINLEGARHAPTTETAGYLKATKAAAKRSTKTIARREMREARRPASVRQL